MVEVLNELMLLIHPVQLVGLVDDPNDEIEDFRALDPQFPTHVIDTESFFELIEQAPPHFHVVEDGMSQRSLEEDEPDLETLLSFVQEGATPTGD
jgi:hypothetical protein